MIVGPRSFDDRIAIIGAGPSGIHMAYRLKELGFRNIEILEKENRIGGRVFDVLHRGTVQQMTFLIMPPDYNELNQLIKEYGTGSIQDVPEATVDFFAIARLLYPEYTRGASDTELRMRLRREVIRYSILHRRLFGIYIPYLMQRPRNARVRRAIRGTVSQFLRRNRMPLIETTVMYFYQTLFGYQQPHRVSAVYGLMWITPKFCHALLDQSVPLFSFFDSGLISLLQTLIHNYNIEIKLNTDIKRITRSRDMQNGNVQIHCSNKFDKSRTFIEYYDFLIVSPSMRDLLNVMDASPVERMIFSRQITDTYFISSLIDSPYGIKSDRPNIAHAKTLLRYDFEPNVHVDIFAMTQNYSGSTFRLGFTPGGYDGKRILSSVYYQLGRLDPRIPAVGLDAEHKLRRYMIQMQRIPYSVIARFITPYHTRFSVSDMDKGIIWNVLDLQGHKNTWYIGASVTYDTAGAVIQYNNRLLRNYALPGSGYRAL
ncbi:hypothetical protein FSP39_011742 [Pinctada imbricata]|uniref:Amine oxidase domain-containing protein n=1 Tax=Pinctada imbricata TaxID=66713 RepID=A0AA89BM49_PINIB|nr:hypothetical protein FSP39_011742 [Pinctada imbricata]